ncbi:family 16 glycoside hydrolase [Desulfovibrio sp. DV]|uniref:family 16 glycoside hydrolase n=1 Tax=Desulfovibrio sp. DV TaxID=1844708 RepID=UPI00094B963E|nr:family 16 glycoside hydrolase [Desulfovibrio sp. DV]
MNIMRVSSGVVWLMLLIVSILLCLVQRAHGQQGGCVSLLTLDIPATICAKGNSNFKFNEQFTADLSNWNQAYGSWSVVNGSAYVAGSSSQAWYSIAYKNGSYDNFDYNVKLRTTGANDVGLYLRGDTSSLSSSKDWYSGYWFGYQNSGDFYIGYMYHGKWTNLYFGNASSVVKPNDWNILRAVFVGSHLDFYINGTLVYFTDDNTMSSGQVGIEFFDGSGGTLEVDYATLSNPPGVPANDVSRNAAVFNRESSSVDHVRPGYSED